MMKSILIVFFLIYSINSNPVERDGSSVCELGGHFVPANNYSWAKRNDQIFCTCPDSQYEINRPCRICERPGICGPEDSYCSEEFESSMEPKSYYACFCSSGLHLFGEKCPEDSSNTTTLTTISTATATAITSTEMITTVSTGVTTTTTATLSPTTTAATATTTQSSIMTTGTATATATAMTPATTATATQSSTMTTAQVSTNPATEQSTSTTAPPCICRSSGSYLSITPYLIFLLNLVYFVNK
ncbi:unnamed protein product [Adineta steineri]|uniref:Uncharacterized protein n=1 Tax=Adineta steineri TaxID=433720 RepID=A0A819DWU5_9BILA|nr:unnamed protein product [Adineta steineri]CAF3840605.1 unnamed protein product [Adineta steineri]